MDDADDFSRWVLEFAAKAVARAAAGEPEWAQGARLDPAVVRSVQRFQVGESGDGAALIRKTERAGDPAYTEAVRLFVAEEANHARMLELLLAAAGHGTIASHWSDSFFVALRRALGLRLELMVLTVAEVVALRYYQALRDGADDPLTTRVAGLVLADEMRHVPFHRQRLRAAFTTSPRPVRLVAVATWWIVLLGSLTVVAVDHGRALRRLGVTRIRFVADVLTLFRPVPTDLARPRVPAPRAERGRSVGYAE